MADLVFIMFRHIRHFVPAMLLLSMMLGFHACIPDEKKPVLEIKPDYKNAAAKAVYELQDRRMTDSLHILLSDTDPTIRYHAVSALSSIGDSTSVPFIIPLLKDIYPEIRLAAIAALGQIRWEGATMPLLEAFDPWDSLGTSAGFNAAILSSIGKCGSADHLTHLATVKTYEDVDSAYVIGQARGIYYYMLRGHIIPEGTSRMVSILANERYAHQARFYAGYYLGRAKDIKVDTLILEMVNALRGEQDPAIRMALSHAIGRSTSDLARTSLIGLFPLEKDYRVRCVMLKGLTNFDFESVKPVVMSALQDSAYQVGIVAAEVIALKESPSVVPEWLTIARQIKNPWVKVHMYQSLSRLCPVFLPATRTAIQQDIKSLIAQSKNPYLTGAYLKAYGKFVWNTSILRDEWNKQRHPYIKTAAMEALKDISDRPDFNAAFGQSARSIRRGLAEFFLGVIASKDPGSVAVASEALRSSGNTYKEFIKSDTVFVQAMSACVLPQEIETYNELAATLAWLKNNKFVPKQAGHNHPIDWTILKKVSENSRVILKTSKGNIIISLLPDKAPGSVANFVQLTETKFYNGKVFHRVVPNFVVQSGCPRGDGYGSLNYTIRSEVGHGDYEKEGRIGMASAGLHTEGVQFFITTTPAPHLNGRYTVFGQVEDGMDVVHRLTPGDTITEAEIIF